VQSAALPASSTEATVDITPDQAAKQFDQLATVFVAEFPSLKRLSVKSKRILTCVFMTAGTLVNTWSGESFQETNPALQLLFLDMCLKIALSLPVTPALATAGAAAAGCSQLQGSIGVTGSRSRGAVHVVVNGTPRSATARPPLAVSCRAHGSGIRMTVRSRKRGRSLRQLAGPRLTFGFVNRGTRPIPLHAKISVR
jgi:hypothetical protein